MTSTPAARLRELMARPGMITAPGAYDGITARMISAAGHACVYMTGSGTAATYGYPDYGLVTMTEMVANADRIVRASGLPLIADADTGYGNELNVTRAVHEYDRLVVKVTTLFRKLLIFEMDRCDPTALI
ncbi:MAG: isocitrate lyase/PEP mutase family protein, partial [Pseudomonadota bacterium]